MISFDTPWAMALLLVLPLIWVVALRTRTNLSRKHLLTVAALRSLALAAIVVALSQPVWLGTTREISVVYALDVSRSVAADFVDDALNWIDTAQREHEPSHSNLVVFAKQPAVVANTLAARGLNVVDGPTEGDAAGQPLDAIVQSATDIEAALDESLGALSRDRVKRIVLLSDGNETVGAVANVLPRLKSAGARVFALAAKPYGAGDVWVDGIEVPDRLRSEELTTIAVRVFSPEKTRAQVSLASGGQTLASKRTRLNEGINLVKFDTRMPQPGAVSLTAEVSAERDTVEHNNRLQISAWVGDKAKVLYVEGKQGTSKYLAGALRKEGLEVDVAAAQRVASLQTLLRYDALILSDVPADQFSPKAMLSVGSYVRDHGGGLVFVGGENTFGEQGYSESPMEDVLPVEFKAQEKRKDIALVIAIDRSYSMKGRKMEYAKEAARAALDLLEEQHQFAVVAFDSQPYVAVPMQQVRSKRKAEAQISRIQASGQTNIYPALGIVYRMLRKADARTKHVILLSDGDTHPADFERLLERMRERNIVVSTVTIGEGGNPGLMQAIAEWGEGRNYLAARAESIPQIFTEETQKVVGASLVEEAILPVVKQRSYALAGVDFTNAPPLGGHISVKARDTAEVLLASQQGAALLTRWQYGLGKTVLFASDVKNRWSAQWLEWEDYGKLWAQLVRGVMRQDGSELVRFSLERDGDDAVIELMLLTDEGRFRDGLSPVVRTQRGAQEESVPLRQVGPGVYRARVDFAATESITATLRVGGGVDKVTVERAGTRMMFSGFPEEYRSLPPNLDLLQTVALETGGKLGATTEEIFEVGEDSGQRSMPLWPWLALVALFAYLMDLLLRRLPYAWRR
ncbi:MAG: VWA domain-containing protein, partial [Betaproteobacteria bacterium]